MANATRPRRAPRRGAPTRTLCRFAPNFTAYVLPPDVVCLYSEDRKFFLHGELYCALAAAIGERGKSASDLVRELGRKYPSDKIEEALKRLTERRYVLSGLQSSDGTVAGYWASLGLPPDIAETNLKNCRVLVESIDVKGAAQLSSALSELGVNIVKRSPDLTVTLVNDYLERQLAELNNQRVADKAPWLLVQPSGLFPLVGPVFKPDETACWTCLFDRMIRNREIKGFLERGSAQHRRRFAARPQRVRAKRHPVYRRRNRQSDRLRLSHRFARSYRELRPVGRDHRQALRGAPPAMPDLRQQEIAEPAPRAAADRESARAPSSS